MADGNSADSAQQVQRLEEENRKMQIEFNMQRAKMKDLFIQKEAEHTKCQTEKKLLEKELDELKSQFLVADLKCENEMRLKEMRSQEEISSLQQMVQDTFEETTNCKSELERIKQETDKLRNENRELRENLLHAQQKQQQPLQQDLGLGPQMLNQVKKTLVRKLGGERSDGGSLLGNSFHQESIDESNRTRDSNKQYAHEDAEVLETILVQLQEEMNVLKEKLREADEKLQTNPPSTVVENESDNQNKTDCRSINKSTSFDVTNTVCDSCLTFETKIQEMVTKQNWYEEKVESLQKNITESCDDLKKEAALRKDLEEQWQEKREAHKTEVQLLREQVKQNEQQLLELQQKFHNTKDEIGRQLQRVTDDRETVNKQLEMLQADNDFLSGLYLETAEEIDNQFINLPNTVGELQELMLRLQNELIQARVDSEFKKKKCLSSIDEIQILRDQLNASSNEQREYKKKVEKSTKSLQDRLTEHIRKVQDYETTKIALERRESELNKQISELRVDIIELQEKNEKLNKINSDSKAKIKNLQDDLITSEQVQKDFVKLSQTLQMSLEKLRQADTNVRWQDDEDIDNCPSCSTNFTVTVRRIHCRHCGIIYCDKCLTKTVPSGPRKRVARVCDMCHTLLTPNTAPYFSHEPMSSS
ncbi:rab GTPase-binding effector protein 1 [Teleopsis dalmanni]|uniref:rab GTPase-binding effector protein 1 n=1 Tax=Teleopsis dalmanni TaxID=139649 RepID=UPI0018CDAA38|nr:rab GTPase-binding effector protein 1 [Teleopsis dalmanni]